MDISVVVITKNEEKNIKECLLSIRNQKFSSGSYEIILVDAHSTDNTIRLAEQYTDKIILSEPGMPVQRNLGIKESNGKYILLLDADMRISEGLIEDCFKRMEEKSELVGLYIEEYILGKTFFHKIRRFERSFYSGTVIDCVRFVRSDTISQIGGYDETILIGEDWDLDRRFNIVGRTELTKTPLYHDEKTLSLRKYIQKKSYYPTVMDAYLDKWGKNDPIIKKQFGAYYRLLGIFVENGNWKKLLFNPNLTFGLFIIRFIVAIRYTALMIFISKNHA
jgi:glycosyltransferase involved in cell wall biosynthesis